MCLQAHRNIGNIIYKMEKWLRKKRKEIQESHQNYSRCRQRIAPVDPATIFTKCLGLILVRNGVLFTDFFLKSGGLNELTFEGGV